MNAVRPVNLVTAVLEQNPGQVEISAFVGAFKEAFLRQQLSEDEKKYWQDAIAPSLEFPPQSEDRALERAIVPLGLILRHPTVSLSLPTLFSRVLGKKLEPLKPDDSSIRDFICLLGRAVVSADEIHPAWILIFLSAQKAPLTDTMLELLRCMIFLNPGCLALLFSALVEYLEKKKIAQTPLEYLRDWLCKARGVDALSLHAYPFDYLLLEFFRVYTECMRTKKRGFFSTLYDQLALVLKDLATRFFSEDDGGDRFHQERKKNFSDLLAQLFCKAFYLESEWTAPLFRCQLDQPDEASAIIRYFPLFLPGLKLLVEIPEFGMTTGQVKTLGGLYLTSEIRRLLNEYSPQNGDTVRDAMRLLRRTTVKAFSAQLTNIDDWRVFKAILAMLAQSDRRTAWIGHRVLLGIFSCIKPEKFHSSICAELQFAVTHCQTEIINSIDPDRAFVDTSAYHRIVVIEALQVRFTKMKGRLEMQDLKMLIQLYFSLKDYVTAFSILERYLEQTDMSRDPTTDGLYSLWKELSSLLMDSMDTWDVAKLQAFEADQSSLLCVPVTSSMYAFFQRQRDEAPVFPPDDAVLPPSLMQLMLLYCKKKCAEKAATRAVDASSESVVAGRRANRKTAMFRSLPSRGVRDLPHQVDSGPTCITIFRKAIVDYDNVRAWRLKAGGKAPEPSKQPSRLVPAAKTRKIRASSVPASRAAVLFTHQGASSITKAVDLSDPVHPT